jgi:hypothetical protein
MSQTLQVLSWFPVVNVWLSGFHADAKEKSQWPWRVLDRLQETNMHEITMNCEFDIRSEIEYFVFAYLSQNRIDHKSISTIPNSKCKFVDSVIYAENIKERAKH